MANTDTVSKDEYEAVIAAHGVVVDELKDKIEHLEHIVEKFTRLLYGRKSEKAYVNSETGAVQEMLFQDEEPDVDEEEAEKPEPRSRKRGSSCRPRFRAELERVIVEQELEKKDCKCCGNELRSIGVEKSEKLEFIPATVKVLEIHRHKYACSNCKQARVKTAPVYPTVFWKSAVTDDTRAHFAVQKFVDHLPYYRQSAILRRNGVELCDETIGRYVLELADRLAPIVLIMRAELLASDYVQADETTLPVLKTERAPPGAHRAYLWAYGIPRSTVVFEYQLSRSGQHPKDFLKDFSGTLQTDRYNGYDSVRKRGDIIDVAYWAHCRRKFDEAKTTAGRRTRSVLKKIGKLYGVEKQARKEGMGAAARAELRQKHALPILVKIRDELIHYSVTVRPSTPFGEAISYALKNWEALTVYTGLGHVEIDTNLLENSIRPIALGRKNYMFAGSPVGAEAAATLYSITETCRRIGVNPYKYLTSILRTLATEKMSPELMQSLTPVRWAAAQAT